MACAHTLAHMVLLVHCAMCRPTHSWQYANKYPKFVCASYQGMPFTASLGAKNGVPARTYDFQLMKASSTSGNYQDIMVRECSKIGMKPVCDHPHYCKNAKNAIYLGQSHHIAYPGHRNNGGHFPSGWSAIAKNWDGICSYTAHHGRPRALCNVPSNTHSWRTAGQTNKFMCGKVDGAPFTASLGAKNGVPARAYEFQVVKASSTSGNYQVIMVPMCSKIVMKPVCDHPNYCKNDKNAIYLGQTHHVAHAGHRRNAGYFPQGWTTAV